MAITSYNLYTHTCIYSQTTKTKFETPRKGKHTMSMIRYRHTQTLRCKYKNGCRIWRCAVMLPVAMITQLSFLSFSTELMIFHWSLHEKTRKQNCFKKKKNCYTQSTMMVLSFCQEWKESQFQHQLSHKEIHKSGTRKCTCCCAVQWILF